ncbi:MAG: hypothetical protein ACPGJS_22690 [Flammeovirgaceae bacterium]
MSNLKTKKSWQTPKVKSSSIVEDTKANANPDSTPLDGAPTGPQISYTS